MLSQGNTQTLSVSRPQIVKTINSISNKNLVHSNKTNSIHTRSNGISKIIGSMLLMS